MRTARGVCGLLLTLAAGVIPAASAATMSNGTGPLYSVSALRKYELFGVHLGMRRDDARKALAAAGLKFGSRYPDGPRQDVTSESYEVPDDDRRGKIRSFSVEYQRWPGRVSTVSGMSYDYWFATDSPDVERRIADVARRFGPPSTWNQWNGEKGDIRYSAAYVPLAALVVDPARHAVTECMLRWICLDGPKRADCRKTMKDARVPIVEIQLSQSYENYIVSDYEADYAVLARTAEFHEPRSQAICPIPRVH